MLPSGPQVAISSAEYGRLVRSWTEQPGRRRAQFPRRLKPRLMALHYILMGFRPDVTYTEDQVNSTIQERNPFAIDHVQIRRYMVDYGMLGRRGDGSRYRVAHTYLALARWDSEIPGTSPF